MTVYLDQVFLLNAAVDYFLCLLTARSAGIPLRRTCYLLAALAGGLYAAIVFLPGAEFLSTAPAKIVVGLLIPFIAYGREPKRFRLILLFGLISSVAAGMVLGLGLLLTGYHSVPGVFHLSACAVILIGSLLGLWLVLQLVFRPTIQHGVRGTLLPAQISIAGKICSMTALHDTGNRLRDPIHGAPVLIISQRCLEHLLPDTLRTRMKTAMCPSELLEPLREYAPELNPCLLFYRAIGCPQGSLLALRADWGEIGGVYYPNLIIGISPEKLSSGYDALWGGDFKQGGHYEKTNPITSPSETIFFPSGNLLHRRERHTPATADKRT